MAKIACWEAEFCDDFTLPGGVKLLGVSPEAECFFCHSPMTGPGVYWAGDETVVLHARCAAKWGAHLLKDALEAETGYRLPASPDFAFMAECMAENWRRLLDSERAKKRREEI